MDMNIFLLIEAWQMCIFRGFLSFCPVTVSMWTLTHDIFMKSSRWFEDFIDSEYLFIVMDILRLLLFIIVSKLRHGGNCDGNCKQNVTLKATFWGGFLGKQKQV